MFYAIKLNTNIKSVGYTGNTETKKANSTAAAHALRKVLGKVGNGQTDSVRNTTDDDRRNYPAFDSAPKPYGKHEGTQHAALLATGELSLDNLDDVSLQLDNCICELNKVVTFDFDKHVGRYQEKRSEIVSQMAKRGISIISPEDHKFYRDSLKEYSFKYCKSQITIILWDTVKFNDNCMFDDKRGVYVYIIKGKTVITRDLINATELKRVEDAALSKDRKSTRLDTNTTMVLGKVQQSSTGMFRLIAIHSKPEHINSLRDTVKSSLSWTDIDRLDL